MHINLSAEMEQYLQNKIASGDYSNASEVVRDAIRRMRADEQKIEALRTAIQTGKDQIARGEFDTYTPELLEKITQKAYANAAKGKKIKPDVLPAAHHPRKRGG